MKKLFVVTVRCIDPNSKSLNIKLDPVRTEERPIQFDSAYLYYAENEEEAIERLRYSIYGRDYPVSAREFTDEEYKIAFEKCSLRKIEWLKETLSLNKSDDLFDDLSNKKLKKLVIAISEKFAIPIKYR